jgi:hypothetical protein
MRALRRGFGLEQLPLTLRGRFRLPAALFVGGAVLPFALRRGRLRLAALLHFDLEPLLLAGSRFGLAPLLRLQLEPRFLSRGRFRFAPAFGFELQPMRLACGRLLFPLPVSLELQPQLLARRLFARQRPLVNRLLHFDRRRRSIGGALGFQLQGACQVGPDLLCEH